jgi:hypothetical protein
VTRTSPIWRVAINKTFLGFSAENAVIEVM